MENLIWEIPEYAWIRTRNLPSRGIVSLDLGYSPDETAILFAMPRGKSIHIFDELTLEKSTTNDIAREIKRVVNGVYFGVMDSSGKSVDQTSGLSTYKDLQQKLGCRFMTKKTDRLEMYNIAQRALMDGTVTIDPACVKLTEMFNNFAFVNSLIPTRSPYKHIHDAFVYLIYNTLKARRKAPSVSYGHI